MELFPSVKITDEKIMLVIPLVFAEFVVVEGLSSNYIKKFCLHLNSSLTSHFQVLPHFFFFLR